MKALTVSNVETVLVFRSWSPIVMALLDYLFLGRTLPSARSVGGLALILAGATGYVFNDNQFLLDGLRAYFWVFVYFVLLCFQMTYGKKILDSVPMKSIWGPVLYTNFLSIPPTILLGIIMGDFNNMDRIDWTLEAFVHVLLSCVIGVGIGYYGWSCRAKISATSYTMVGVLNKLGTVLVSVLLWSDHASLIGILSLSVCLFGGLLYEQVRGRIWRERRGRAKLSPSSSCTGIAWLIVWRYVWTD